MPIISELFMTIVQLNGRDAVALIDYGAAGNMLSPLFANLAEIKTDKDTPKVSVTIADGTKRTCAGTAMAVPLWGNWVKHSR
jgi:predicted aspartyl protease